MLDACKVPLPGLGLWTDRLKTLVFGSSGDALRRAEQRMLEGIKTKVHVSDVAIPKGSIHTVSTVSTSVDSRTGAGLAPVVLIHGYFMGSASWSHSFDALSSKRHVYAIDWPSWGLSCRNQNFPSGQGTEICEQFFVEGIESWRRAVGLEKMVLLGHSFGGYFAACYTMKYPQHVDSLILASPVGMLERNPGEGISEERIQSLTWWQRWLFFRVKRMWETGWTPMDFVRGLGPFGSWLTEWYMDRRFRLARANGTMELDAGATAEYLHRLAQRPRGSEQCLGDLLQFGAWPKSPVAPRLAQTLNALERAPPVTLLYGDADWMDARAGAWLAHQLGRRTEVMMVENAGHQLFMDNPRAFNAAVGRALGAGAANVPGLYQQLLR